MSSKQKREPRAAATVASSLAATATAGAAGVSNAMRQEQLLGKLGGGVQAGGAALNVLSGGEMLGRGAGKWATGDKVGGGLDLAGGVANAAAGTTSLLGLAGGGAASLGTAVGAAGAMPVVGAVASGLGTGISLGQRGNRFAAEHGLLGDDGEDWSSRAADVAFAARERWGETAGLAAGGVALIPAAAAAAVTGAAGMVEDTWNAGKRLVGKE